jgi:hypothetical protein
MLTCHLTNVIICIGEVKMKKNPSTETQQAGKRSYEEVLKVIKTIQKKVEAISNSSQNNESLLRVQ